jgi:hypothetical protein
MPFFTNLKRRTLTVDQLATIHHLYQSAMHATRAGVYLMPHLNSPHLRKRKLPIFVDDDGLPDGDTHHYQLTRAFRRMGVLPYYEDEAYGDQAEVTSMLSGWPRTARFVRAAFTLYPRSLGPWPVIEGLSSNWMHGLADGLAEHHPDIAAEPYFAECFAGQVEEHHADEALRVTCTVLQQRPNLIPAAIRAAHAIARALDGVWKDLNTVITRPA